MITKRSSLYHRPLSISSPLRYLLLLLPLLFLAGCGDVEWLPEYEREPTAPDSFSFAAQKGVELGATVTSEPVTVSGIIAGSAPISVSGPDGSSSKYSIDGNPATDTAGTVSNGAKVTVIHTASKNLGGKTTSTLTIGNVRGTFSSTTRTVYLAWQSPTEYSVYQQAVAVVTANDNAADGYEISIRDSLDTSFPEFAVTEVNTAPDFGSADRTVYTLNNQRIYVRNRKSNNATTTLTIDGVDYTVDLTP